MPTLAEWLKLLDSANDEHLALARETTSSIEVSRTSKGEYSWHIKLYGENADDAAGDALMRITRIDARLRELFLK
jgi:hypothetical protein